MKLEIVSAGYDFLNRTGGFEIKRVKINNIPLDIPQFRGFNVAFLNGRDGSLRAAETFDTHYSTLASDLLINYLYQNLRSDDILIMFILDEGMRLVTPLLKDYLIALGSSAIRDAGSRCPLIFCKYNREVLINRVGSSEGMVDGEVNIRLPIEQEQEEAAFKKQIIEQEQEEAAFKKQIADNLALRIAAEQREQAAYLEQVKAQQEAETLRQQQIIAQREAKALRQQQINTELREQSTHRQQITESLEDQLNKIETNHSQLAQIIEQIAGTITWLKSSENNVTEEETNALEHDLTQLKVVLSGNMAIFPEARQLQQQSKNIENAMLI